MTIPFGQKGLFYDWSARSSSSDGKEIARMVAQVREDYSSTVTIGFTDIQIRNQLHSALKEAFAEYASGARLCPSIDALMYASEFIQTLPTWTPIPDSSVDPDGEIGFDWYCQGSYQLSVSIGPAGRISYAARMGSERRKGSVYFAGELPDAILEIFRRLFANDCKSLAA
jgi:hypothetical protein